MNAPRRCHSMLYCIYDMLNKFRGFLCPSSGARDYMCVITACGVQCLVTGCRESGAGQQTVSPGRVMFHDWPCQVVYHLTRPVVQHHLVGFLLYEYATMYGQTHIKPKSVFVSINGCFTPLC